jgi:hypothetical protein
MLVEFKYDIGNLHMSKKKEMQSNSSKEDIIKMYENVMCLYYHDTYCSYEILKEGD